MQLFKKITEALDQADNGGERKGNAPGDSVPVVAQVVSCTPVPRPSENLTTLDHESSPSVAPTGLEASRCQATSNDTEVPGSSRLQSPVMGTEAAVGGNHVTRGTGGEWEVVPPAVSTSPSPSRMISGGDGGSEGEIRPRATDAFAEEAARILRSAAIAAEALAPRLSSTLRRAEAAETEVLRLKSVLEVAEARIKDMEKQQEKLTEGFIKEIQQRDAEIATYKAAAETKQADREVDNHSTEAAIDVLTFTEPGKLGVEFDQSNDCLKILSFVAPQSQADGRLFIGDEVVSVSGFSTRNLSWEEMLDVLSARPVVLSVRRAEGSGSKPSNPLLRTIAGWTARFAATATASKENETPRSARREEEERVPDDDLSSLEDFNRPFYELVRASMAEAVVGDSATVASEEEQFEQWLRQFHNERDDEWYVSNHVRLINAFKPHWDQVVEAHRALAAS